MWENFQGVPKLGGEETWSDQQKDNDNEKDKGHAKDNDNDKDKGI